MSAWLPTLLVVIVTAVALAAAGSPPVTPRAKRLWMLSIVLTGSLAIAGTVWQGRTASDDPAALAETTASPETSNGERDRSIVSALNKRLKALEDQVRQLASRRQVRTIAAESADKLAAYLQQFGTRRIIVSCIPDDIEAYQYANQLVHMLKAGNWDAQGPELTKIFGDVRAQGINIYVGADHHSDTVKILLDGFAKFDIPYQSRVTPSRAILDSDTVELFIGTQQSQRENAGAD